MGQTTSLLLSTHDRIVFLFAKQGRGRRLPVGGRSKKYDDVRRAMVGDWPKLSGGGSVTAARPAW